MMRGFKDCALEAGCSVTGGQTVMNPWCTVGGVATTVCQPNEFIMLVILFGFMTHLSKIRRRRTVICIVVNIDDILVINKEALCIYKSILFSATR